MAQAYLDFDLEIGAGDGLAYPLAVLQSPAGNARAQMIFPFRDLELENRLLALQNALLKSGGARRKVLSGDEQAVRDFGRGLFAALFRDDVRSAYDVSRRMAREQGCGLRLKLRFLAPDLAALPWEYLFDERLDEYVGLSYGTPIVRFLEAAQPVTPLIVTPPLRILGMIAAPTGLAELDVAAERQRLERAVANLTRRGLVQLRWLEGQTRRDLHRAMRPGSGPWHIFHFIGHGGFDAVREEGLLAFCDAEGRQDPMTATELGRAIADHPTLRLVVLNACESATAAKRDIFSSTAATLVRRGVPAAVAMQYEITDRAAVEFAGLFYEALAEGLPVDAAVTDARKGVSGAIRDTLEWGIPVLMMRSPDGVIFEVKAEANTEVEANTETRRHGGAEAAGASQGDTGWVMVVEKGLGMPSSPADTLALPKLRQLLTDHFDANELRTLCFDLGVDFDDLPGEGKAGKARELVAYLDRRGQLGDLLRIGRQQRPDVPWPGVVAMPEDHRSKTPARVTPAAGPIAFDWVTIPAGEFLMGSDKAKDKLAYDNEIPQHTIYLPEYCIARVPVTVAQFAAFVGATGHKTTAETQGSAWNWTDSKWEEIKGADWSHPRGPQSDVRAKQDHPITCVSWHDALAFCKWAGVWLPFEAEWEKAARGTDGRIWPWGNREPNSGVCNFNMTVKDTTPVGRYPDGKSPYGLLDVAGNVWEWTSSLGGTDASKPEFGYPYDAKDERENSSAPDTVLRTLRGGSFWDVALNVRCAVRGWSDPGFRSDLYGFRVVSPGF